MVHPLSQLPEAWRERLGRHAIQDIVIGRSAASVHRLTAADGEGFFVKTEAVSPFADLPGEAARLRWLGTSGIPCPIVIDEITEEARHWLLLSAVPGSNLAEANLPPEDIVEIVAQALHRLHSLEPGSCPFDHRVVARIELARTRVEAGLVDEDDFDAERLGIPIADLIRRLEKGRPAIEDMVVAHGDACLPNLIADRGIFSGFVDCGRLGVSDRYQDLALAQHSIRYNLGSPWDEIFLIRYGGDIDRDRLAWFRLLDEFF